MPDSSKHRSFLAVGLCLVLLVFLTSTPGTAQTATLTRISFIDASQFPNVTLNAIIRDDNNNPVPVVDVTANMQLFENGTLLTPAVQQVAPGVETVYIIDMGAGSNAQGATGRQRRTEIVEVIGSMVDAQASGDVSGIITVTSSGVDVFQPLTVDKTVMQTQLTKLPGSSTSLTCGASGIYTAVEELTNSLAQHALVQSIVMLSIGIQSTCGSQTVAGAIAAATDLNVPVHVMYFNNSTGFDDELQNIAAATGGLFTQYKGSTYVQPYLDWLSTQRTQTQFTYRSTLADLSERTVQLKTTSGQLLASTTYQVNLAGPQVIVDAPANNSEVPRTATQCEQDMDSVDPRSTQVLAHVVWTDGLPRTITEAQILQDDVPTGAVISNPGDSIVLNWDVTQFRTKGDHSVQLRVRVKDELGFTSTSDPVLVKVVVITDPPTMTCTCALGCCEFAYTEPRYWLCQLPRLAGCASLGVALLAIILAVAFRKQVVVVGKQATEKIRETVARLTRPPQTDIGAYLQVLQGEQALKGRWIPLYLNTTTPVGRDRRQVEVVLDADNDYSVISRKHCEFRHAGGNFTVRDWGSTHGTIVQGRRLNEGEEVVLHNGDQIQLGPPERGGYILMFVLPGTSGSPGPGGGGGPQKAPSLTQPVGGGTQPIPGSMTTPIPPQITNPLQGATKPVPPDPGLTKQVPPDPGLTRQVPPLDPNSTRPMPGGQTGVLPPDDLNQTKPFNSGNP